MSVSVSSAGTAAEPGDQPQTAGVIARPGRVPDDSQRRLAPDSTAVESWATEFNDVYENAN